MLVWLDVFLVVDYVHVQTKRDYHSKLFKPSCICIFLSCDPKGASVKRSPQRWQDEPSEMIVKHNDVTICFEERIFDAVVEDLQMREPTEDFEPIHVICLDTKDNPHEAAKQGQVALDLCWRLEAAADDLVLKAAEIVDTFQEERMTHTPIKVLYQLCYL